MSITSKLLIWVLVILAFVVIDRQVTKDGNKPVYLIYFLLRGIAAILHGILMDVQPPIESFGPVLVFQVTSFWIIYEITRNIINKKPLMYYDTVEKDSGWIDRFFAWAGDAWHFTAKVAAAIACGHSITLIYRNL